MNPLGTAKYVLLTTFRRDGRPVATPIWVAPDGDALVVWTGTGTGKVKRIRNSGRVTVAPCDFRGTTSGPAVSGQASLLPPAESERARALIRRKYGLSGWLVIGGSRLRRGRAGTICVRIELDGKNLEGDL